MKPLIALTPEAKALPANHAQRGAYCGVSYTAAVAAAGGLPLILPLTRNRVLLRQILSRCQGLLLTGGADVSHKFYAPRMSARHRATIQGAAGLAVTARADDGVIEAIEHVTARFFWGVQFHPERLVKVAPQFLRLFQAFVAASSQPAARRLRSPAV